jgi:uracil-DNA glycosylase family 4
MSDDKIKNLIFENIITDTEAYLKNLSRFYTDKIYIETMPGNTAKDSEAINKEDTETIPEKKMEYAEDGKEAKHKSRIEKDLFGNEIKVKEDWEFAESLDELYSLIHDCSKCRLRETRTKFVFGVGNPNADIVVIGEAPGADEDLKGEPFVGRAGQLLNKILEATGFKREEVYICNIVKNRPPANRNPLPDEVDACKPYLDKQLDLIKPKLLLLLGRVASESLLKTKEPLNKLRGKVHNYKGYKVMITFHPAALLRNPNWKKDTWEDMKKFKKLYEELISK